MVRDTVLWNQFESEWQRSQESSLEANLRVFYALIEHARSLGAWPPEDLLEGLEHDIRLSRVVNTYVEEPARKVEGKGEGGA